MPFAIFDYMGAFLRNGFAHVDNVNCYPRDQSNRMAAPVQVARRQTTPRNSPEPSEPCLRNLHQHTPEREPSNPPTYTSTHRNSPELSGTFQAYLLNLRQHTPEPSGTCLWNQHHFIAELSGTFRNLLREATPAHTGTLRNLPEPSKTFRNLRQHTPEPSEIFRNLPELASPEPSGTCLRNLHQHTPEPSGTFRNLPEPASGTCSCDPHRHTPELIWAEDPSSLRCWGKNQQIPAAQHSGPLA